MSFSVFAQLGIVLGMRITHHTLQYKVYCLNAIHILLIYELEFSGICAEGWGLMCACACACANSRYYSLVDILWTQWNASRGWQRMKSGRGTEGVRKITKHPSFFTSEPWQTTKRIRKCAFKYASHIKYGVRLSKRALTRLAPKMPPMATEKFWFMIKSKDKTAASNEHTINFRGCRAILKSWVIETNRHRHSDESDSDGVEYIGVSVGYCKHISTLNARHQFWGSKPNNHSTKTDIYWHI